MKRLWGALGLVLTLIVIMPEVSAAQQDRVVKKDNMTLGQNYPNPFNPETTFPFTLGDYPTCSNPGKQYRVSLTVFNILGQVVAKPVLQGPGVRLEHLLLTCGDYRAYWDGKDIRTGREAASGVYLYKLEVDGAVAVKRMLSAK